MLNRTLRLTNLSVLLAIDEFMAMLPIPGLTFVWAMMANGYVWVLCGRRFWVYYWVISIGAGLPRFISATTATASTVWPIPIYTLPDWVAKVSKVSLVVGLPLLGIFYYKWFWGSIKEARKTLDRIGVRHE